MDEIKKPRFSGWPLFGQDGIPSARQILGVLAFVGAFFFGKWGMEKLDGTVSMVIFIPMAIFAFVGLLLFGFVTWQSVQGIIEKKMGISSSTSTTVNTTTTTEPVLPLEGK